jgi:hypothetical protein
MFPRSPLSSTPAASPARRTEFHAAVIHHLGSKDIPALLLDRRQR